MNYNKITVVLTIALIALVGLNYNLNQAINVKEENIKIIKNENDYLYEQLTESNKKLQQYKGKLEKMQIEEEKYTFYDIPLSKEVQIYTQKLCKEYNIDYLTVIALLKLESNFQPDLISDTNDYGISQINSNYITWYSELAGLETCDPFNEKDSIAMCVAGLAYYRDYWIKQGITDKEILTIYTLNTYNMGYNYKNYIKENGTIHRNYNLIITKNYEEIKDLEI